MRVGYFGVVCWLAWACSATSVYGQEKRIRDVVIVRQDVFPDVTGKPRFLYEWANGLHIVTRETVIRRELLFKPGDAYDPDLLEESERKLRALPYLGEVRIEVEREGADFVDVRVTTQDQWSTLLSWILNTGGGRTIFGGSVEEFNFLGLGKRIFVQLTHEVSEGPTLTLRYNDPQLLFSRWTAQAGFVSGPFIKNLTAQLVRPFYSLDTRWAFGLGGNVRDEILRLFEDGQEASRLRFENVGFEMLGARAFGTRYQKAKLQLSYRFQKRDFETIEGGTTTELPNDELIHALAVSGSLEFLGFVKERQIDRFVKTEDITLGSVTTLRLGRTGLPFPVGVRRFELNFTSRHTYRLWQRQYLLFLLGFQTLFERDTIWSFRLRYYNRLSRRQTLAFNLEFDYGHNLERSRQFLLGGDSGLRGYPARGFSGNKRLLLNLEDRLFSHVTLLTVALGGVVFVDAGHVWREHEPFNLRDLNFSVGVGLRLGYTKSPNSRVGRFDFAWRLNGGGGFGFSIGVDQQFSLN